MFGSLEGGRVGLHNRDRWRRECPVEESQSEQVVRGSGERGHHGGSMTAEWTLLLYLAGDNNLQAYGEHDLEEMKSVGSTREIHLVPCGENRLTVSPGGACPDRS